MSELFGFWPFNLPASEGWVFLYLVMAGGVLFFTHVLCIVIGAAFDRRSYAPAPPEPLGGGAYRTPGIVARPGKLAIGQIPHEDEVYVIAFMRGGTNAVAEVIAGRALGQGYLTRRGEALERAAVLPDGVDPVMHRF
ncbi:MAG TPA: hypothetical protein VFT22_25330, partial [Kofleriaceae bacterium]|nr:hypothetical protein [Kofleriaceae bacterium]